MKPVDQRYYRGQHRPMGDCLRACVASIFEMGLDEVPHFVEIMYQRWARHETNEWEHSSTGMLNNWAWSLGVGFGFHIYTRGKNVTYHRQPISYHPGYWIASVASRDPTSGVVLSGSRHAVVMLADQVVHDPNPDSRASKRPYRFAGEMWFELAHPQVWMPYVTLEEESA